MAKYSGEFRREIVAQVRGGRRIADVAREAGVPATTVQDWVNGRGLPGNGKEAKSDVSTVKKLEAALEAANQRAEKAEKSLAALDDDVLALKDQRDTADTLAKERMKLLEAAHRENELLVKANQTTIEQRKALEAQSEVDVDRIEELDAANERLRKQAASEKESRELLTEALTERDKQIETLRLAKTDVATERDEARAACEHAMKRCVVLEQSIITWWLGMHGEEER